MNGGQEKERGSERNLNLQHKCRAFSSSEGPQNKDVASEETLLTRLITLKKKKKHKRRKWKEVKECIERDVHALRDPPEKFLELDGQFPLRHSGRDAAVRADLQGESARAQRAELVPIVRGLAFV